MEEKSRWLKPVLICVAVVMALGAYLCAQIYFNRVENQSEVILDKESDLKNRLNEFDRMLDYFPRENSNGDSLKIFPPEILQGFKELILDQNENLGLRARLAEVLLWRDPEGEMRTTIALLVKDRSQPRSLRNEALKVCADQTLLSDVIMCEEEKKEFRNQSIWRSEDKELLRRLLQSDNSDSRDMRYLVASRLCMIDKEWLRTNIVYKQNANPLLRVALMSFCFRGEAEVIDSVFSNKNEDETIRAMALENMVGYPETSRHNIQTDRFLMTIMMDSDEGPLIRTTAILIYRKARW